MKSRLSMIVVAWVGLSCATLFGPAVYADDEARAIFVNQVRLRADEIRALALCNPMNHSTPGLPVHHQLPEFT